MIYLLDCLHCHARIRTTERVGDAVVATVEAHLRADHADMVPAERRLDLAEVLGHVLDPPLEPYPRTTATSPMPCAACNLWILTGEQIAWLAPNSRTNVEAVHPYHVAQPLRP